MKKIISVLALMVTAPLPSLASNMENDPTMPQPTRSLSGLTISSTDSEQSTNTATTITYKEHEEKFEESDQAQNQTPELIRTDSIITNSPQGKYNKDDK